jgi:hypothetical protein
MVFFSIRAIAEVNRGWRAEEVVEEDEEKERFH